MILKLMLYFLFDPLPSGYGFVNFKNPHNAKKAVQSLKSQEVVVMFAKVSQ